MAKVVANQDPIKEIKQESKKVVRKAAASPFMDGLMRWGYAVKGFIYVAIGFIAISGALGDSSTPADQLGAIAEFSKLPFAQVILWAILIGLIAYSLWGIVRAILDPFQKGHDLKGLAARGGYLISAATYATFVWPTFQLIIGARRGTGPNGMVGMVSKIMNMPMGRILVGALGVAAVGAGIFQIMMGIKRDFDQRFKPYALSSEQRRLAIQIGRFGTIARGIVFTLAGYFLFLAAYESNPGNARGFDAGLDFLAKQPYGIWLLGIIALGLIAFGIYSFMSAAWFRLTR